MTNKEIYLDRNPKMYVTSEFSFVLRATKALQHHIAFNSVYSHMYCCKPNARFVLSTKAQVARSHVLFVYGKSDEAGTPRMSVWWTMSEHFTRHASASYVETKAIWVPFLIHRRTVPMHFATKLFELLICGKEAGRSQQLAAPKA
jgi:hypothetical protein